jgi:hypothetical protein
MTFTIGYVEGGTNAGNRVVKPAPRPWMHICPTRSGGVRMPGHWTRCPDCKTKRPT